MSSIVYLTDAEFGPGSIVELPGRLARLQIRRPLLVSDHGIVAAGLVRTNSGVPKVVSISCNALLAPGCVNATCCEAFRSEPVLASAPRSRSCFRWSLEMIGWSGGAMPGLRKRYTEITSSQLSPERMLQ
ncbi:hypothetical protein [Mesorhizobium zhangyense]|uniref:hypothetical protein n=1 Tax=Mesorhizobium zhangyense TaxID=1776730 RepID=UPI001FE74C5D|nr:hypothetical protein [Mesorhizobium zhangyense]